MFTLDTHSSWGKVVSEPVRLYNIKPASSIERATEDQFYQNPLELSLWDASYAYVNVFMKIFFFKQGIGNTIISMLSGAVNTTLLQKF